MPNNMRKLREKSPKPAKPIKAPKVAVEKHKPTIIVDTREQQPLIFGDAVGVERSCLTIGDYSVRGLESRVRIERKRIGEIAGMCGGDRDRLDRQVKALCDFPVRMLIIEGRLSEIVTHSYVSEVAPLCVIGMLLRFMSDYQVPVMFCDSPAGASLIVQRLALREFKKNIEALSQNPGSV